MKKKITVIFVALSVALVAFFMTEKTENIQLVEVVSVTETNVFNSVITTGYIEERNKEYVSINQNGIVENLNFKLGDNVKKGDEIMTIAVTDSIGEISKESILNMLNSEESVVLDAENDEKIKILSNVSGIITKIPENTSEAIILGIPFLTISNTDDLVAKISIPEKYVNKTEIGQSVRLSGVSFLGELTGEVTQIMPYAKTSFDILGNSSNVNIDAFVEISNINQNIIPGCTVEAKIIVDKRENSLVIPYEAIFQIGKTEYVNCLNGEFVESREITTGYELESGIEITSGIEKNDIIILTKNIENGQKVRNE